MNSVRTSLLLEPLRGGYRNRGRCCIHGESVHPGSHLGTTDSVVAGTKKVKCMMSFKAGTSEIQTLTDSLFFSPALETTGEYIMAWAG